MRTNVTVNLFRAVCLMVLAGRGIAEEAVPLNDRVFPEQVRRWSVPTDQLGPRDSRTDDEALRRAAESAEGWVRAVVHSRHMAAGKIEFGAYTDPTTKEDLLRGTFESNEFRFEVTQSRTQFAVIATDRDAKEPLATRTADFDAHIRTVVPAVFNHPAALMLLVRVAQPVKGGLVARMSDTGYDRQGIPMPFEDYQRLQSLPQADRERKQRELTAALVERVKEADATVPRDASGCVQGYWWGRVMYATNGRSLMLIVDKLPPTPSGGTAAPGAATPASTSSSVGADAPDWVPPPNQ